MTRVSILLIGSVINYPGWVCRSSSAGVTNKITKLLPGVGHWSWYSVTNRSTKRLPASHPKVWIRDVKPTLLEEGTGQLLVSSRSQGTYTLIYTGVSILFVTPSYIPSSPLLIKVILKIYPILGMIERREANAIKFSFFSFLCSPGP